MADASALHKRPVKHKRQQDAAYLKNISKDIPNSRLYAEMRELDLRFEQYTNRKKADIFDLNERLDLQTRSLRLHMYNQHFNQNSTDPEKPPAWSFFIYGQFLDQDQPSRMPGLQGVEADKKVASNRFWTTAMSSIEITTSDPTNTEAPCEVYQWHKNRHVGQHKEGIEIHRLGSVPVNITVRMVRDYAPELKLVNGPLADALSLRAGTRGQILHRLWDYVKAHSTPDADDPAWVNADADMKELLGETRLMLGTLGQRMDKFLSSPDAVTLQYKVVLEGPSPCTPLLFDIDVAWSLRQEMLVLPAFLERFDAKSQLNEYDSRIAESVQAFRQSHRRYKALMGFATNPVEYIYKFIAASALEVRSTHQPHPQDVTAVTITGSENFALPWAHEAAVHLLTKEDGQQM